MQKFSTVFLYKNIKNYVIQSFISHKLYFLIFWGVVILGAVCGVFLGKSICSNLDEPYVENFVTGIICGESGLLSLFSSRLVFYVILLFLSVLTLLNCKWGITFYLYAFMIMLRTLKNVVILFFCGGLENLLCAMLFYLIFDLIYTMLFSFFAINVIIYSKYKVCKKKKGLVFISFKSLVAQFLFIIFILFIYSIIVSLPFILLSV